MKAQCWDTKTTKQNKRGHCRFQETNWEPQNYYKINELNKNYRNKTGSTTSKIMV